MQSNAQSQTSAPDVLPLRGNDAVDILINDHTIIKTLLASLVDATQAKQRQGVLEQLKAALTIHNATEENLVYPALAQVGHKKAEAQHLYEETAAADQLIFQLDTMLKTGEDDTFARVATTLQSAILEHIDDEEQKAFPHLQDRATADQARLLTASVRELRTSLRFAPGGGTPIDTIRS
jgi:hemerythrin superfamily protein